MGLPFTPGGIVRCRDLIQATQGVRIATSLKYRDFGEPTTVINVLQPDPRRIRYELTLAETSGNGLIGVHLMSVGQDQLVFRQLVVIGPAATIIIDRDWRKDGDAVTYGVWIINDANIITNAAASNVSVRETILTVLPADEPVV